MRRVVIGLWLAGLLGGCSALNLGRGLGQEVDDPPGFPIERMWERDVQAAFGPSAALLTDQYVVVGTRRGEIVVLDRTSGDSEGAVELGTSIEGAFAVSADRSVVFVPTADRNGGVTAYDVMRGQRRWVWKGGAVQGGVVRVEGTVVTATLAGTVAGLDAATGEPRWVHEATDGVQVHASPVVMGSDVLVADDQGHVRLYDAAGGALRWTADVGEPVYATPTSAEGAVFVSTTRGSIHKLDAATGATQWTVRAEAAPRLTAAAVADGVLLVAGTDGIVRQLDVATGDERWRFTSDGVVASSPLPFGGYVAIGTMDERVVVLDGDTGHEVWSTEVRGRVKSAIAAGGGMLVVLTEPRHVIAFRTAP